LLKTKLCISLLPCAQLDFNTAGVGLHKSEALQPSI